MPQLANRNAVNNQYKSNAAANSAVGHGGGGAGARNAFSP